LLLLISDEKTNRFLTMFRALRLYVSFLPTISISMLFLAVPSSSFFVISRRMS